MSSWMKSHGPSLILLISSLSLIAGCGKDVTKPTPPPAQTEFFVSAATGSDANAGTSSSPLKTITHAIAVAGVDQRIHVAPGTYDTTNGETFPLVLKAGQTLIGDTLNKGLGPTPTVVWGHAVMPGAIPG